MKYRVYIFLFFVMMPLPGLRAQSPEVRLFDFEVNNRLRSEALLDLSRVSGVAFSFDGALFEKDPPVSLSLKQVNLENALTQLLQGSGVGWKRHRGQIILYALPPENILLSGFVEDAASGERLIGARIVELHSGRSVLSNSYGYFCLNVPAGTDPSLAVFMLGYQSNKWPLKNGKTKGLYLKLQAQTFTMQEVSVEDAASDRHKNKKRFQRNMENLAHLRLQNTPALGGERDLQRVIALEPGAASSFDGLGGWSIRGGETDQNLVLMDDAVVFSPLHAFGLFSTFNPDVVRSAQLWKGDAPARLGGGASSVMEVRTREGNMQRAAGALSLGWLAGRMSLEMPIKKDRGAVLFSVRRSLGGPVLQHFMNGRRQNDSISTNLRYYFNDVNLKANWVINRNNRLYLSLYSGRDYYAEQREYTFRYFNGFEEDTLRIKESTTHEWRNRFISLRWNHLFSERCFANTTISRSNFTMDGRGGSSFVFVFNQTVIPISSSTLSSTRLNDLSLKTDLDYYASSNITLRGGYQLSQVKLTPFFFLNTDGIEPLNWVDVDSTGYITPNTTIVPEKSLNLAVYAAADWRLTEAFQVSVGVRAENFRTRTGNLPSWQPRLQAHYHFRKGFSLSGGLHWTEQFFRVITPNYVESLGDFWLSASPELPAQRNRLALLGLQKNFAKDWALKVEAFHKRLQHVDEYQVYWTTVVNPEDLPLYVDGSRLWEKEVLLGDGRVRGLECSVEKTQGRLSGSISCTFSRSERRFEKLNEGQWFSARFDRLCYFKSLLHYRGGKHFSVSVAWHFATGDAISRLAQSNSPLKPGILDLLQPSSGFERIGIGDYRQPQQHRLDVNANWEWRSGKLKYTLSAGLYNAYNRENAHFTLWLYDDQNSTARPQRINGLPVLPHLNIGVAF